MHQQTSSRRLVVYGDSRKFGPSGILVGRSSAISDSASRYSYAYAYSKTPESIQVDPLFRDAKSPVFSPFVNEIPVLPFEYEYRFTEYEYEKNQWYELPATIMPDGTKNLVAKYPRLESLDFVFSRQLSSRSTSSSHEDAGRLVRSDAGVRVDVRL
jgi:hypothetical protein